MRPLDQQVILVTGSIDGLSRSVAEKPAARGAAVRLHGRAPAKGEATPREIREATGNERLAFYLADFGSLAQVRGLAEQILADPDLDGVTGRHVDRMRETLGHPQAYDPNLRHRLHEAERRAGGNRCRSWRPALCGRHA